MNVISLLGQEGLRRKTKNSKEAQITVVSDILLSFTRFFVMQSRSASVPSSKSTPHP